MDKPIRCAVMGQHPLRFPWGFDEGDESCGKMKMELAQQIMVLRQNGVSQFLVACDCGVGLYAAEIVNGLRATTDHDLMLICYTPHEEQTTKWAPYLRERYFDMLTACTYLSAVCEAGAPGAQLQAYKKIIDLGRCGAVRLRYGHTGHRQRGGQSLGLRRGAAQVAGAAASDRTDHKTDLRCP